MRYPVDKVRITSEYGIRGSSWHYGLDFGSEHFKDGDNIFNVSDGIVKISKNNAAGYGEYIVIEHNGFCSLYAHLLKRLVKVGQKVSEGEIIGLMGHTPLFRKLGTHLHFETRIGKYDSNFWNKTTIRGKRTPIQCTNPNNYLKLVLEVKDDYKKMYEDLKIESDKLKTILDDIHLLSDRSVKHG